MKQTLSELGKLIKSDNTNVGDISYYGEVKSKVIEDDRVVAYNVQVGDSIIEARRTCGADVGDIVLCTTLNNGLTVVSGKLDGDADIEAALDAAQQAQDAVEVIVEDIEGLPELVEDAQQAVSDAQQAVSDAQDAVSDAQAAASSVRTIIREYNGGVLVCKTGNTVGALVNANGSFDVVEVTWSDDVPSAGTVLSVFGEESRIGSLSGSHLTMNTDELRGWSGNADYFSIESTGGSYTTRVAMGNKVRYADNSGHTIHLSNYEGWSNVSEGDTFEITTDVYCSDSVTYTNTVSLVRGTEYHWPNEASGGVSYNGDEEITIWTSGYSNVRYRDVTPYYYVTSARPIYKFGLEIGQSTGANSFITGQGNVSNNANQLIAGKFNEDVTGPLVVGNGTDDSNRSNAFRVGWDGNVSIAGDLTVDGSISAGSSVVGTIYTTNFTGSASANATWNTIVPSDTSKYLTLPVGKYMISYCVFFNAGSGTAVSYVSKIGARLVDVSGSGTAYVDSTSLIPQPANNINSIPRLTTSIPVEVLTYDGNNSRKFSVQTYNNNVKRNVTVYLRAIRIA